MLHNLLRNTNYDEDETQFIVDGFTKGFDMGYRGPMKRQDSSSNIPLKSRTKKDLWNKVMQEVKLRRVAGPFSKILFKYFVQSPIGLIPKNNGKHRLIFHLSYDFGENKSINQCTPKELCSVKYNDLDVAVWYSLKLTTKDTTFYGSMDLSSAFRILPTKPEQRCLTIMKAEDPISGRVFFFVNKNLAMGSSISCSHFQQFSNCLRHITECIAGVKMRLVNYLDDYLFMSLSKVRCLDLMNKFKEICEEIGVPIAAEKTIGPTCRLIFLGILLLGDLKLLCIPIEKKNKAINMLNAMLDRKKATVKQIEKLTGVLNFLTRAVFLGRAFTRRLYAKISMRENKGYKLKGYHHVYLDREFKKDCQVWKDFLTIKNLTPVCRPFVDLSQMMVVRELNFFSDASSGKSKGFGCYYKNEFIYGRWEKGYIENFEPCIEYLEFYALCIGLFTWRNKLRNKRVVVFCDNNAVVGMITKNSTRCRHCMILMRMMVKLSLECNMRIFAVHIKREKNKIADSLSKLNLNKFFRLALHMKKVPESLPIKLWPASKISDSY